MPFDAISEMTNPVTGRTWGSYDAAILHDAAELSGDYATEGQWAKLGECVISGSLPEMVAFTRGDAVPAPGARFYPVFSRQQLESWHDGAAVAKDTRESLLSFLVRKGGVRDHGGELRCMDASKRRIGLVRINGGMKMDMAREAAEEAGYLPRGCGINHLLDAISAELRGHKCFRFECGTLSDCPF